MRVYKHPLCFCCNKWISHIDHSGMSVRGVNTTDMAGVRAQWGIPDGMASCHTGVVNGTYVFEGHIPARYVREYLKNPPEGSIGLAVPGMPAGSPGMYTGGEFAPYNIYLLLPDGNYRFYTRVESAED